MFGLKITIEHEVDTNKTLGENVLDLLKKLKSTSLNDLEVVKMQGREHTTFKVSDVLSQARSKAYEQHFNGTPGEELKAIGQLKPTDLAVVKQIKEFYNVENDGN